MERSYTAPLARAWDRMRRMLFQPFHVEAWLVLGFSAFLARMLDSAGGSFGWNLGGGSHGHDAGARAAAAFDQLAWLLDHPIVLAGIAVGMLLVCVALVVLGWVSARAQFVFLENVVLEKPAFLDPWRRHGRLGNSLFLWGAAFSFAWLVPAALIVLPFANTVALMLRGGDLVLPGVAGFASVGLGLLAMLVIAFVLLLAREFVVPLMWRHQENATEAWIRFGALFRSHPGEFVAYALFLFVLGIGAAIAVLVAGIATCCVGLLLMLIPYLGAVVLLPVHVTGRALGPEFLAQFGPEWDVFPPRATTEPDATGEAR